MLGSYDERRVCLPTEVCHLHKLIPGSGVLSLKVVRDGPTRVLRIVDIRWVYVLSNISLSENIVSMLILVYFLMCFLHSFVKNKTQK